MKRWNAQNKALPILEDISFVDVADLTPEILRDITPDIVMSALVVRDTDAVEIARLLVRLKFAGRYRVVADDIPNAELIQQDVAQAAPSLDFAVISLPAGIGGGA